MFQKEYEKIFDRIENCFTLLKCRLFVDQWLQECTELFFTLVNKTDNPVQMLLFEKTAQKDYSVKSYDLNAYGSYDSAIDDIVCSKKHVAENVKQELRIFELWGCELSIWCVCVSPCIDKNNGSFLLRQAFRTMVESLRDWCLELEALNCELVNGQLQEPTDINNWHDFVQSVLRKTYERIEEQLEGFYSPVKIPYINSLSGEYYEKTENSSNLLFLPKLNKDMIDISRLKYDFRRENCEWSDILFVPENIRRIRKLTQIARDKLYLIFQTRKDEEEYEVLGICEEKAIPYLIKNNQMSLPYFICKAKRHMQWDLFLGDKYIFSYMNGNYRITQKMPIEYLEQKCRDVFPKSRVNQSKVYQNVCVAQEQSHGTMLVILLAKHAKKEGLRFSDRAFGMCDTIPKIRKDVLDKLDSIDGSILMDIQGKVHCIGVILDGDSDVKGDPARGARYNSALRYRGYLNKCGIPGLILVVSEDGSVEILDTKK